MVAVIVQRGLLTDTVIVSDEAGQFHAVSKHASARPHAERHLRQIISVTDEQQRWVHLQRIPSGGSTPISKPTRTSRARSGAQR